MGIVDKIYWLATAEKKNNDIFSSLGIDWTLLIVQIIAFILLLVILKKYVYPVFANAIDKRQKELESSAKAVAQAEENALKSEKEIEKLLNNAKLQAKEIVLNAKTESEDLIKNAEEKAMKQSDKIISDAKSQLDKDVIKAKSELRDQTVDLVALLTEKFLKTKLGKDEDIRYIKSILKDIK